jgi:hypothetical protein
MKAGNCEHEHGVILELNRTPDEMYMATQPRNKQNISHCLQETTRLPDGRQRILIPPPPGHPRTPAASGGTHRPQPRTARTEGKGGGAPIRRRRRRSAEGGMPRYGPGKGEDWLIARAVGFIVLSQSCSGSGHWNQEGKGTKRGCFRGEGRREDVVLARQAGLLVLGYGATRVPTPAW